MRRTQAGMGDLFPIVVAAPSSRGPGEIATLPPSPTVSLSALRCVVCHAACDKEGAVFAYGSDPDRGAVEWSFCCLDHAKARGWPWIDLTRRARRARERAQVAAAAP